MLTFALGLVRAYLATRREARKDLEADYDRDLRADRVAAYRELWKLLEPLARYAPPRPLDDKRAGALQLSGNGRRDTAAAAVGTHRASALWDA